MNRPTERLPIDTIIVGERLRQDDGDIAGLAESIQTWGLIHPLTVASDNTLIAGGRRLKALRELGYDEVEVRRWEQLTDAERRELELEENLQRKDLTAFERSRKTVELAEVAAEADRESFVRTPDKRSQNAVKPGSLRRVEERTGVARQTIHDAKQHVAAAETYPVLQKPDWKQYQAMEAAEILGTLPEPDRAPAIKLIDQPGIPPQSAIPMLRNLSHKPAPERAQVFALAQSADERERSLALTKAIELPPMPDPRWTILGQIERDVAKCIRLFPNDPEVPELRDVRARVKAIAAAIDERNKARAAQSA